MLPAVMEKSGNLQSPLPLEAPAWAQVQGTWRRLHGDFTGRGLSVEWHDFRIGQEMDWARSFHSDSLEVCLNFAGAGALNGGADEQRFGANEMMIYALSQPLRAVRYADGFHRFLTLELAPSFLQTHFGEELGELKPAIRRFIEGERGAAPYVETKSLPASLLAARTQFVRPPVPPPAQRAWYLGRVLEILAQTLFAERQPGELFCQKHQRVNRERVERVRYLLERDLENPPSLEMLAQEVACSPFYLSRMFAQETGASIPKFLRMKRMEKAAEMLRTGRTNVTEAAVAVGYSSLSAFSKAFVEHFGCCPGLYPHVRIAGRK